MTIMDRLRDMFHKNDDLKQFQREDKIRDTVQERKKNSNERELERFMEEDRQKMIKQKLDEYRKNRQHDTWTRNDFIGKPISMLHSDKPNPAKSILSSGNMGFFGRGMFFK